MKEGYSSKTIAHLGLISGICKEFNIAGHIDKLIPVHSQEHHVTTGQAVAAMILNGLGFVNQRLYLVSKFFEDKPVDKLIGQISLSNTSPYSLQSIHLRAYLLPILLIMLSNRCF